MWKYAFNTVQQPVKLDYEFKAQHSFEKRKIQSSKIRQRYNDIIPVIVEKSGNKKVQDIQKSKFLVDKNMNVAKFLYTIRCQLKIDPSEAMFLFINNKVIPSNVDKMGDIYLEHMDNDGFLYITYSLEHVFG